MASTLTTTASSTATNRSSITSIPSLAPVTLLPRHTSPCAAPLAFLESIDVVEINGTVERDGVVYFVLDVYLKPVTSRIPTTQLRQKQQHMHQQHVAQQEQEHYTGKRMPDYQIEKRFSDFANLRYQVWVFAQRQPETRCALSNQFMDFIVHSFAQPRLLVRLATTTSMRKKLLATFCNEFLHIAVHSIRSSGAAANSRRCPVDLAHTVVCEVRQAVPTLLARFFRQQDGDAQW